MNRPGIEKVFGCILLVAIVAAVYGMTFLNAWTYDDMYVVVNNPDTYSFADFLKNSSPGRPLRELTHLLERQLFGVQPAGYHVLQLLLHAGNGIMLFLIMMRCGIKRLPALVGAVLFLVHPLQAESVANIGHRKELLALCFGCLSLLSFQCIFVSSGTMRHVHMALALLMFVVSLAGNETALTFPLVWLGYEYIFVPRERSYILRNKSLLALFLCLVLGYGLYRITPFLFNGKQLTALYFKNNFFDDTVPLLPHIMAFFAVPAVYGFKFMFPQNLAPEYVIPFSRSLFQPVALAGLIMLLALIAKAVKGRKNAPAVTFGILWGLALYLPVSNFVPVGYSMADRYMYLPLAGAGIALAGQLDLMGEQKKIFTYAVWPVLLALSVVTMIQNSYWRNEFVLWEHAVKVNPLSSVAQESAAHAAMLSGRLPEALTYAREAVHLNPYRAKSYFTLAMIEEITGDYKSAIMHYRIFILNATAMEAEQIALAQEKMQALQSQFQNK